MSDYFLADDLSGALDAAAAFHHAGQRVTIVLSFAAWPEAAEGEVIGFTTETRNAAPTVAMEAVTRAIAHARSRGGRLVYKKIDSTLRGPVAPELAALAAAMPGARILFTPANPRVGRTVRHGELLVGGVPVAETDFARDPVSPVRQSSIRRLLGEAGTRVIIADAETEADLEAAVAGIGSLGEDWVAVGSGALARPVATARCITRMPVDEGTGPAVEGPAIFVCGSAHAANRDQAQWLAREHAVPVHEVSIAQPHAGVAAAIRSVQTAGAATLLVESVRGENRVALAAISGAATQVIMATGARRIFVTGGETAFALCQSLGISALHFCAELEPGLSLSRARMGAGDLLFAVKPGGFGDAQTWARAWQRFERGR